MSSNNPENQESLYAYTELLRKVEDSLVDAESRSWDTLKDEVEKAIEFEQGVEALTKEEWSLIKTYLLRDLKELSSFVAETGKGVREWLRFDLDLLETKMRDALLSIADKTSVEQENLDNLLNHEPGTYAAGEIACPGVLRCSQCGKMICLVETAHIAPCHRCEGRFFQRVTSRWPYQDEVEGGDSGA